MLSHVYICLKLFSFISVTTVYYEVISLMKRIQLSLETLKLRDKRDNYKLRVATPTLPSYFSEY